MAGKRSLLWIEALRTVAMLIVVVIHVDDSVRPVYGRMNTWTLILRTVTIWAVPAFFVIAGYLLGRKPPRPRQAGDLAAFSRKKLHSLIIPYLAWNFIYMILFKLVAGWDIFTGRTLWMVTTGYVHLYFVFVLLQFFFLYQLVEPRLKGRGVEVALGLAGLCSLGFYASADLLLWMHGHDTHFFVWHYGKAFVGWSLFFFYGVWLGRRPQALEWLGQRIIPLAVLCAAALYLYFMESKLEGQLFGSNARLYFLLSGLLYQFLSTNLVMVLARRFIPSHATRGVRGWLVKQGGDTFGIYLSHLMFVMLLHWLWLWAGLPNVVWVKVLVMTIVVWCLSQGLTRLPRLPGLRPVNGVLFGGRG